LINTTAFQIHLRELASFSLWPGRVIPQTIQHEVGRQLREAGATYDALQVTVPDRARPYTYQVSYRGLENFPGTNGAAPGRQGGFVMEYIGGGQWQGALAGTLFTVSVGSREKTDLPFVNDPGVIGEWKSVDFVVHATDFKPGKRRGNDDQLYLEGLTFLPAGRLMFLAQGRPPQPGMTWTKDAVMNHEEQTASHYEIRELNGQSYLFFEWKSGDYTFSGMKPCYYVLKRI
jgi:hypothetical protein